MRRFFFFLLFAMIGNIGSNQIALNLSVWDISTGTPVRLVLEFEGPVVSMQDIASMRNELRNKVFFDFSPNLEHNLQVINERTIALTIQERLSPARRYHLTVRTSDEAMQRFRISGRTYRANTPLFFETPRQGVRSAIKTSDVPNAPIRLSFFFPVDLNMLRNKIRISPTISFSLAYRNERGNPIRTEVILTPSGEQRHTSYTLTIDESLTPIGGELGMAEDYRFSYSTYQPLRLVRIRTVEPNNVVYRDTTIIVEFNNTLDPPTQGIRAWAHISPSVDNFSVRAAENYLYISGVFLPGTNYRMQILPTVRDEHDQVLGRAVSYNFSVEPTPSFFDMPTGYLIMENYLDYLLSLRTINIGAIHLSHLSLTNPADIADFLMAESPQSYMQRRPVQRQTIRLPERWNTLEVYQLPLKRYHNAKEGFWLYSVTVDRRIPAHRHAWTPSSYDGHIQFTDISATLKRSADSDLIIARSLRNNAPLTNANVYSYNERSRQFVLAGRTSRMGLLLVTNVVGSIYMVESEDSRFYISARRDSRRGGVSENIQWGRQNIADRPACLVFSDRHLYQPGETVFLKGIYRYRYEDRWVIRPPFENTIQLQVRDSRGNTILSTNFRPFPSGSFDLSIDIPRDAPTGEYSVTTTFTGRFSGGNPSFHSSFRVEEFRPARAEMRIRPDKPLYFTGDTMNLDLIGWYLFGAPIGNPVGYSIWFRPAPYRSRRFPAYSFSSASWQYDYDETGDEYGSRRPSSFEVSSGSVAPNRDGVASVRADLSSVTDDGFLIVSARTTLPDDSPVAGVKSDIEIRKRTHLGVRVPSFFHSLGEPFEISLVALDGNDNLTTNRAILVVNRSEWRSFRVAGHGGRFQWEWREVVTTVFSNRLTVHHTRVPVRLEQPGYYTATVYEQRGNALRAHGRTWFYAIGGGFFGWRIDDDDRVEVLTDKSEYNVGDTATILIKNPFRSARAVITVERERFYRSFDIPATNSMVSFTLPIEEEYIPNIFVSVMLYTGRTGVNQVSNDVDHARPQYRIGYANLRVTPREKALSVDITTDKSTYEPRERVNARVSVRDHNGRPVNAELTISVADRGVLNLVNYRLPNPLNFFYAPRPLAISTYESRRFIYGQRFLSEKGEVIGGDGGIAMGMIVPRAQIRYTAFYEAKLSVTNGVGNISFVLPDNLTSFRIMAVAHTPTSKFGYGESDFTVRQPLMILETFPTFIRLGDRFMAGGMIFNYSGQRQTLAVEMSVSEGLSINRRQVAVTNITIENNASREVLFPVVVNANEMRDVSLTLKAQGNNVADGITKTIPVMLMRRPEQIAIYGMLTNRQNQAINTLTITTNIIPEFSSIEVTVAPTAFVELKGSLDYLITYPYGCSEQKISRILPLITGEDVILKHGLLHAKTREDLRGVVQTVLDEMPDFFKENGFSYWRESSYVSGYLTAYIFWVMTLAREAGYRIDPAFYNRVFSVIRRYIDRNTIPDEFSASYRWLTISFALYAASMNGHRDIPRLRWVYNEIRQRDPNNLSARAFLLMALSRYGEFREKRAMREEIVNWFKARKRISAGTIHFEDPTDWGWFYYTTPIKTAIALQAFLDSGVDFPDAYKVINYLIQRRQGHAWRHTHENAWIFYAFSTYLRKFEREDPVSSYEVSINAERILSGRFENRTQPVQRGMHLLKPEDFGQKRLTVSRTGRGTLYYVYRYRYVPRTLPNNRSHGFSIEREFIDPDTGRRVHVMQRGKDYLVRITVSTPVTRHMVVVDDRLPAGVEVVNLAFATESGTPHADRVRAEREGHDFWRGGFSHNEVYRDRVIYAADILYPGTYTITYLVRATTPGTFAIPGCHVEEMYNPENFATLHVPDRMIVQ